ncbi:PREDICTED: uncharacterized protein At4g04775-like [Camelina sativa]|uniref:Uncharacterized protein At4g04775-like n=1 Tax=Camelina sativa TaxID=90675 RepID=A0ABM1R5V2_CAMSA|nr:PREDICTED: uncharacterized protein At4g04775-like [Camelina sativa]
MSDSYSLSNTSQVEYEDAEYGIPTVCYCGERPRLEPSFTRTNPGRLFYTCQNRDDGECHIWKWWDVAMMEELRALKQETYGCPSLKRMREIIQVQRDKIAHLYDIQSKNQMELDSLKVLIANKRDGIAMELKNVFVAAFVLLAMIIYLF